MFKFYFLGEDERIKYLKEMYKEEKKSTENMELADIIVTPIPFSKDGEKITGTEVSVDEFGKKCINKKIVSGAISKENRRKLEINNVEYIDLMELDEMAILNAIPTAEGTVLEVLKETNFTIFNSNVLVLGFGRVGKIMCNTFKGLGANVFCEARKEKDLALIYSMGYNDINLSKINNYLENMDIIINTIPYMMLDNKRLQLLKKECFVIDVSSKPGGVDFEAAKELKINAKLALGIPAKVAPKTAAEYMKKIIDRII